MEIVYTRKESPKIYQSPDITEVQDKNFNLLVIQLSFSSHDSFVSHLVLVFFSCFALWALNKQIS